MARVVTCRGEKGSPFLPPCQCCCTTVSSLLVSQQGCSRCGWGPSLPCAARPGSMLCLVLPCLGLGVEVGGVGGDGWGAISLRRNATVCPHRLKVCLHRSAALLALLAQVGRPPPAVRQQPGHQRGLQPRGRGWVAAAPRA